MKIIKPSYNIERLDDGGGGRKMTDKETKDKTLRGFKSG